jgi:hypothetical protein
MNFRSFAPLRMTSLIDSWSMEPEREEFYINLAQEHPDLLCSEAPLEILEAASFSGEEPTEFLKAFLAAGHKQWLLQCRGKPAYFDQEQIDRAVVVLWLRACDLYTSHLFHRSNSQWDKPFFSDEGLYD